MKKIIFLFKIFITSLFFFSLAVAENIDFFKKGKNLFENKKFDESKIFFERDIVFNPLSEYSYIYLAKIFNEANNYEEEEVNLKNALLINPNNSEAVYMLANVNIRKSDYDKAKELIQKYILVCKNDCSKKTELKEKFDKIVPKNEKN